ncbi:hypothetical protein I7I51_05002 [Histoplasma capsulatum]|uniref:Uncharacterized protein n=1 Tax=Ajellomyces capsulatus TaxID=5037 RepID=A0A8A1M3L7_AJECA|nr:predicted protein [Histoplasma mississippiense (nom. inval.)]EDN09614.1 predicted protein [Histoplasma mississippiense (nom. inval.)]QSS60205.1 hypothetical protein I7I51_05002 [Histoplasma capsulatum]
MRDDDDQQYQLLSPSALTYEVSWAFFGYDPWWVDKILMWLIIYHFRVLIQETGPNMGQP